MQYENYFVDEDKMIIDMKQRMKLHSAEISEQIKSLRLTIDECAEIGQTIDNKMNLVYTEVRDIVTQIQQNTINIKNMIEPALEAAENQILQTRQDLSKSFDAYESAMKDHKELFVIPILPDNFKPLQSDLKSISAQKVALAMDSLQKVTTNNTNSLECGHKYAEALSMDIPSKRHILDADDQIQTLKQTLLTNNERIFEQNKENIDVINDLAQTTDQMSMNTANEISACIKHVTNFRERDFCEYQPSGNFYSNSK